jgi:hypothetical protein
MNLALAITLARPNSQWSLVGDTIEGLTWISPGEPPTLEELQEAWDNRPPEPLPDAENYQIRAWMIRGDLDPDAVPQIISQVITDAKEKKEALMRWDYAVKIPRNFPLVDIIGLQMGLTPEQINAAWPDILSL